VFNCLQALASVLDLLSDRAFDSSSLNPDLPSRARWQGREQRFGVPEVSPRVVKLDLAEPLAATIKGREEVAAMAAEGIRMKQPTTM